MKNQVLNLDDLNVNQITELSQFEQSQKELVASNPYVEIVDNTTYEQAKKNRTALVKGRTSLENQEKVIASKLSNFRKQVGAKTKELIEITLPHEEKQQTEVKRFEQIKENERLERERIENERIESIKKRISDFENESYSTINSWNNEVLAIGEEYKEMLLKLVSGFDFEEFDILFEQAKHRVMEHAQNKIDSLVEKENQRIENERLAREKAEADAKLQAIELQQEKELIEREEKERIEKEKVFEVRVKRLNEVGIVLSVLGYFTYPNSDVELLNFTNHTKEEVLNFDVIEFEDYLEDCKKSIKESVERHKEKEAKRDALEKEALEAKKKAEKENKERQKRLAKDKAIYEKALRETMNDFPIVFDSKQEEIKNFSIEASNRVTDLLNQLLTELKEL